MTIQSDDFFSPLSPDEPPSGGYDDFFKEIEEPSRLRSLLSAFPKGAIKAAQSFSPLPKTGPVPEKLGLKLTEEFLPTEKKLPEEFLERAGKVGTFLAGGEGTLASKGLRTLFGAIGGQTAKELGAPEIAQDIIELSSASLPDLSKKLPVKQAQERVVNFLKNKGFTDNEITPLLQSPQKLARYAKFASKGTKTNKLMRDTYEKFDNVYSSIRDQAEQLPSLPYEESFKFLEQFEKQLEKIPKFYKRLIKEEIDDLTTSSMKFTDFMDFDQAVNARIKGVSGGKAILGTLKESTANAKKAINPQLADDLNLANELYGKRADVTKHLSTDQISDLFSAGEAVAAAKAIADQNLGALTKVIGLTGARKVAREMIINPRLQNISNRMLNAINKNNLGASQKLYEIFKKEAIKENDELEEFFPEFES